MIQKIAEGISAYFCKRDVISADEKAVYTYGMELMLMGALNVVSVLILGACLGFFVWAVIYNVMMVLIRQYTGGYHAKTHMMCEIIYVACFFVSILLMKIITGYDIIWLVWVLVSFSLITICTLSPVENVNKQLSDSETRLFNRISVILYVACIVCSIILYVFGTQIVVSNNQFDFAQIRYDTIVEAAVYMDLILIIIAVLAAMDKLGDRIHIRK